MRKIHKDFGSEEVGKGGHDYTKIPELKDKEGGPRTKAEP